MSINISPFIIHNDSIGMNNENNNTELTYRNGSQDRKQFIENIQNWVLIDEKLKLVNEKAKQLRDMRHEKADQICEYLSSHPLPDNKVPVTNGYVQMYEKKEYPPLTFAYIEESLSTLITSTPHVEYIMKHLKEGREIKTMNAIRGNYSSK